ncbi:MAG: glycosyltransferase family 2 protein [Ilumatobacteraceae bacterium]
MPGRTVVVIPCFDEAERLDPDQVFALTAAGLDVLLVDDGSSDGTVDVMKKAAAARSSGRVETFELGVHVSKAEAVRRGMRPATAEVDIVGFCDADFATPPDEVVRLAALRRRPELVAAIGSRVDLLGHEVDRPWFRATGNRVYSAVAARLLRCADPRHPMRQKFFRTGVPLSVAIAEPFADAWGVRRRTARSAPRRATAGGTSPPPDAIGEIPARTVVARPRLQARSTRCRHGAVRPRASPAAPAALAARRPRPDQ